MKITNYQAKIFQMYADGNTIPKIAVKLNKTQSSVHGVMWYVKFKYKFPTFTNVVADLIRKGIID